MLNLSYEFKLKPTQEQVQEIEHILTVCRKVWNYALRSRKDWLKSRKSPVNACSIVSEYIMSPDEPYPNYAKQCKALTEAKKIFGELKTVNAQVLQQVLRRLETAFLDMQRKQMGFPRFKNQYRMRSFVFPQMLKNCLSGNRIKLPQLGWVEFIKSRDIPDGFEIKQVRIVRKASGYFVIMSLQRDISVPDPIPFGHPLGIDLNLANFLATSDGEIIARPRFLGLLSRKIKLLQRRLKHKKKNSNNRRKLNQKIARLHQQVSDIKKDWHYKLAHHLCDSAGMIFAEDINFKAWAKGMFRKHTLDAGFGQFLSILQWVAWRRGVFFAKVNKDYTSQQCPECGTHTGKKELDERIHSCPACNYTCNRDIAAAQVVRNRGVSAVGQIVEQIAFGGVLTGAIA
ncbi:MAG: RNA-guided endonuclease InsQ/TnpB family protein [Xenococcaceae cyanobacterium]